MAMVMVLAMAIAISTTKTNNKNSMNPANGVSGTKAPERNVFPAKSLTCIEYLSFSASVVVETWIKPHRGGQKDILLLHHWSHFLYTHLFLSGIVWVNSVCTDVLSLSLPPSPFLYLRHMGGFLCFTEVWCVRKCVFCCS